METHQHLNYEEAGKMALTYERQRKKKNQDSTSKATFTPSKGGIEFNKTPTTEKGSPSSASPYSSGDKAKQVRDPTKVLCFKCHGTGHFHKDCPNARAFTQSEWEGISGRVGKRAMIVLSKEGEEILKYPPIMGRGDGAYYLNCLGEMVVMSQDESEEETNGNVSSEEEEERREVIHPEEQRALVSRKNFHATPKEKQHEQRENIFQTKCRIKDQICDMIIDSGSEVNCVDKGLVERLELSTTNHPRPYQLRWLEDKTGQRVRKQCLVGFHIGTYQDEVLCDVLTIDACHLLLGRPWQHDRRSMHDGYSNVYTIRDKGKTKDLMPLPPSRAIPPTKKAHIAEIKQDEKYEAKGGVKLEQENFQKALVMKHNVQQRKSEFKPGEFVFVDWKKGKFGPNAKKFKNKMMDQTMGPFEVVEQRGLNWYCVKLDDDPKIVAMFCKDDLTPYFDEDLSNLRTNSFEEGEDEPFMVPRFKPDEFTRYLEKAQRDKRLQDYYK